VTEARSKKEIGGEFVINENKKVCCLFHVLFPFEQLITEKFIEI